MPARTDRQTSARRLARHVRVTLGGEIRRARLGAGLSQSTVGATCGMSHAQVGRIERGVLRCLSLDQAFRAAAAVGLRVAVSTFPDGDAVRDAAHLRLLERFHGCLPRGSRFEREVPLMPGDPRAWDGRLTLAGRRAGCEAETRVTDVQALDRRLALKERDGDVEVVILVIADTRNNRAVLREHREALRARFPLDGADVLAALRAGRLPDRNGIVVL